jgi:hypothetical protein
LDGNAAARRLRLEKQSNLEEARALMGLALDALEEAEANDFAASVCEDIEALPDTDHESGEDGPQGA